VREASITVIVPVYDNAGSLAALHARLKAVLVDMGSPFEIIYVNDASSDESLELLSRLHAAEDRVTVIDLAENAGQSAAVLAALSFARGEIVVTIDADLENHPEDIPALVAAIRNGADLACGARRRRSAPLLTRRGPSAVANRLVGRALGVDLDDWGCGLNAATGEIVRRLLAQDPLPLLPKIEAALLASRIAQVPVEYSERSHGPSTYTVRRLAAFAATFLRGFGIARSLRRALGRTTVRAATAAAPSAEPSFVTRTIGTIAGLAAWTTLAGAALITRAWHRLSSAPSTPFHIREIRRPRGTELKEPSTRAATFRDRPNDIVSQGR
jgi:hypothetical protein